LGIVPYCGLMGYLTPALIDRWSSGNPGRAGSAYAVNVLGCIVGPLIAGFLLLPWMSEPYALTILALPLFAAGLGAALRQRRGPLVLGRLRSMPLYALTTLLAAFMVLRASTFESRLADIKIGGVRLRRDYQATVLAGGRGMHKVLMVNGIAMTKLTPITKIMAHLPLAFLPRPPKSALVICFGMGTTFRSLVSWGVPATAVELVPSVPGLFSYFHEDAEKVLAAPNARVVIDDGRRFLARSTETFDVITMDPAPPMTAAGTSYLFSEEFYAAVKNRLSPDGIMQQWIMEPAEPLVVSAVAKALKDSFPYTRVFRSVEGWGFHCLASRRPIPVYTAAALAARLPAAAAKDFVEFGPESTPIKQFQAVMKTEISIDALILPGGEGLRDNRPLNEYFLLRRSFAKK
ncbi:MAG: fused MFS/spermidine synthase, partial [Elusimicrobiota bacterium]